MVAYIRSHKWFVLLLACVLLYIGYFSTLTVLRYKTLYASYYDLGIMHQTTYNTFRSIQTADWSRFLEQTSPYGQEQIKRMAIHNDPILALYSLFYFIHSGPETLLILQTVILAFGAVVVFKIAQQVFHASRHREVIAFAFGLAFLLHPVLQKANLYDFHAVVPAATYLLLMFYFWLKKRLWLSFLFFILSILSKEQVPLTTFFFGGFIIVSHWLTTRKVQIDFRKQLFPLLIMAVSVLWFLLSILVIIPMARGEQHFALGYYDHLSGDPLTVVDSVSKYIFHKDTFRYFWFILGPLGFLSFLSPLPLLIATPEFAINLLSSNLNMRNIIYHYTGILLPFVFIASVYGGARLYRWFHMRMSEKKASLNLVGILLVCTVVFAYVKGPLPFGPEKAVYPFKYPQAERILLPPWKSLLEDEDIKVAATGQLAPHFASRRYLYTFSEYYYLADYVVIRPREVYNYPEKDVLIPVYERLQYDTRFLKIFSEAGLEVYKKIQ